MAQPQTVLNPEDIKDIKVPCKWVKGKYIIEIWNTAKRFNYRLSLNANDKNILIIRNFSTLEKLRKSVNEQVLKWEMNIIN